MKEKIECTLTCIIIMSIIIGVFSVPFGFTLLNFEQNAVLVYKNEEINVNVKLTDQEFDEIKGMFNYKFLCKDEPACGFQKDVAVIIGSHTFSIANDSCPVIKEYESGKSFAVSDEERTRLEALLKPYGAVFPCV